MTDLKGQYKGNCNRTACQKPNAVWYNHSTRKYYCVECAKTINYHNRDDAMRMFGHDLCTLDDSVINVKEELKPMTDDEILEKNMDSQFKRFDEENDVFTLVNPHLPLVGDCTIDIPQPLKQGQKRPSKYARRAEMRTEPKIGRNEPCSCGSGLKYKKCCLNKKEK